MYDTAREDAGPTGTATLAKLQDPPALRVILPPGHSTRISKPGTMGPH